MTFIPTLEQKRRWQQTYRAKMAITSPGWRRRESKSYYWQLKLEMIEAYGGKCVCCGETEPEFLTIDHINGRGREHMKQINKRGSALYQWLKHRGFPKDAYRLLCYNCNCARGHLGHCPHDLLGPALADLELEILNEAVA